MENIGKVYQCNGKVLQSGRENFIEKVVGLHLPNYDNPDVKSLHLLHQNLNKLPENLHKIFSNLAVIYVANSNLLSLTAEDLKHFEDLKVLDVWNNKLQSIPGDLFHFTPNIQRVSFAKNPIQFVGLELFEGLENLQQIDFRQTNCIDMRARKSIEIINLQQQLVEKCEKSSSGEMSLVEIRKVLFDWISIILPLGNVILFISASLLLRKRSLMKIILYFPMICMISFCRAIQIRI